MQDLLRLDGRIVVVSGAGGGGIGTTVTAMAARAGATVIAVSRSKENLDEHIAPLAQQGLAVLPVAADASTDEGVAAVLDRARRTDVACTAWSTSPVAPHRRPGCRRLG